MSEDNVTRTEKLLASVASGNPSGIDPITREEMFLSYIAGESDTKPKPITRKEKLLDKIGASGTGGGGGAKPEQEKTVNITENGTTEVIPDEGNTLSKVTVNTSVAAGGEPGKPYIDTSEITDFSYFCYNSRLVDKLGDIDTSNGVIFDRMFEKAHLLAGLDVTLDTSKGTSFAYMFAYASPDRVNIDTTNATNLSNVFSNCSHVKFVRLTSTAKATNMSGLFDSCEKLENIYADDFNTSECTNMASAFSRLKTLTSIPFVLDIKKVTNFNGVFSYSNVLESVSLTTPSKDLSTNTFQGCTALKNLTIGEGWAFNIHLHYSNNLTVESLHAMIENLADLTGKTAKTFQIGSTNLAKIDEAHITMLESKNWNFS